MRVARLRAGGGWTITSTCDLVINNFASIVDFCVSVLLCALRKRCEQLVRFIVSGSSCVQEGRSCGSMRAPCPQMQPNRPVHFLLVSCQDDVDKVRFCFTSLCRSFQHCQSVVCRVNLFHAIAAVITGWLRCARKRHHSICRWSCS